MTVISDLLLPVEEWAKRRKTSNYKSNTCINEAPEFYQVTIKHRLLVSALEKLRVCLGHLTYQSIGDNQVCTVFLDLSKADDTENDVNEPKEKGGIQAIPQSLT
jgi:hypothetical protein